MVRVPTGTKKRNEQTGCRYTPFLCRPVQGIQPVQFRRAALTIREVQRIVTVRDAIARLQKVKPNQYDDATLVKWLSDLDGMIFNDVILTHEGADSAGFSGCGLGFQALEDAEFTPYPKSLKKGVNCNGAC